MKKKEIKVLVVDDSQVARMLLTHIIESDPELKVIGYAENGEAAIDWLSKYSCDVVTMDIHMPRLNGFEVTKKIMSFHPVPIVIISSGYISSDNLLAFKTMEVGALAILEKPTAIDDEAYSQKSKEIIDTIKMISEIKVITRRSKKTSIQATPLNFEINKEIHAIGIGASLGGPLALAEILKNLPSSYPIPIFIVQHISAGFTDDFVRWLQEQTKIKIILAKNGEKAKDGCAYIAPDGCQMEIKKGNIISLNYEKTGGICPSVGHLFKSLADTFGIHCAGIILTGMGRDGALELLEMKNKGAFTIAQDEASCVMFGMPKEAIKLNAAKLVLSLNKIAEFLFNLATHQTCRKK